jgi:hypothetical protein
MNIAKLPNTSVEMVTTQQFIIMAGGVGNAILLLREVKARYLNQLIEESEQMFKEQGGKNAVTKERKVWISGLEKECEILANAAQAAGGIERALQKIKP